MGNNKYQRIVADVLGTRQIAFNPDLARITKSVEAGLLLSQLLYWHKKGRNSEWFYKTIKEIKEEIHLTRSQQDTAIKKLKNLGLIEIKLMGIPRKRFFKVHIKKLLDLLITLQPSNTSYKHTCLKQTSSNAHFQQSNTESTKRLQSENGFNKASNIINKRYEINPKRLQK